MFEILWHGRGGQGAFTAARLVGAAATCKGDGYALAFPSFGPERRGAPVRAFTKIDNAPIGNRSEIAKADLVVYLDQTLVGPDWQEELKPHGLMLVNSAETFDHPRIVPIDADGISQDCIGRIMPNTSFIGAIVALSDVATMDDVEQTIRQYMAKPIQEVNLAAIRRAHDQVIAVLDALDQTDGVADRDGCQPNPFAQAASEREQETSLGRAQLGFKEIIPTLQVSGDPLRPQQYARSTCFEAGHLVTKNAGWRNLRPIVDPETCTGCLQCYMDCPDGCLFKVNPDALTNLDPADFENDEAVQLEALQRAHQDRPKKSLVAVDLDFCKGCGVCAKVCPAQAILMIPEP